jgi:hypothetical protein
MQDQLLTDKIFLLDTPCEMFVWTGKATDVGDRKDAVEKVIGGVPNSKIYRYI